MANLEDIKALLGEPGPGVADPESWSRLEDELGVEFPRDFRAFCDAYGPLWINHQLFTTHPGTAKANLGQLIRSDIEAWSHAPDDMVTQAVGTGPGEVFPWGTAASGQTMFFRVPEKAAEPWSVLVYSGDDGSGRSVPMRPAFALVGEKQQVRGIARGPLCGGSGRCFASEL